MLYVFIAFSLWTFYVTKSDKGQRSTRANQGNLHLTQGIWSLLKGLKFPINDENFINGNVEISENN